LADAIDEVKSGSLLDMAIFVPFLGVASKLVLVLAARFLFLPGESG
jgi:hypothetical protein